MRKKCLTEVGYDIVIFPRMEIVLRDCIDFCSKFWLLATECNDLIYDTTLSAQTDAECVPATHNRHIGILKV